MFPGFSGGTEENDSGIAFDAILLGESRFVLSINLYDDELLGELGEFGACIDITV